jgi:hypothetical protein
MNAQEIRHDGCGIPGAVSLDGQSSSTNKGLVVGCLLEIAAQLATHNELHTRKQPHPNLTNAIAELECAISQSLPSDDQLLMGHVQTAVELLKSLRDCEVQR